MSRQSLAGWAVVCIFTEGVNLRGAADDNQARL
jgi:hypothetical protein